MAIDFVKVDTGRTDQVFASEFRHLIQKTKEVKEGWLRMQGIAGHANDGTNFDNVAILLGLRNLDGTQANGSQANTVINGMVTALDASAVTIITSGRIG